MPGLPTEEQLRGLLRKLRRGAKIRQSDLAARLGQPQSFVSKYESGERRLTLSEVAQICHALGVTLGEVVAELENET